MEMLLWW